MPDAHSPALELATRARQAAGPLAVASRAAKDHALAVLAELLHSERDALLAANSLDIEAAMAGGLGAALIDRLRLDEKRIAAMAQGVREIIALPDPVGRVDGLETRPNGLQVGRMRIPLGVICIIYESRPNVTIDAGALCIKSGNAPILKGGRESFNSNEFLVGLMRRALETAGLPADGVQAVATSDRDVMLGLIRATQLVDLVIPRGGENLIRYVTENATVPVIQHYKGVCSVYVHADADPDMATDIAFNAKVQRPGVCNAMENLLIHREAAPRLIPQLFPKLRQAGVELRGDARVRALALDVRPASDEDWSTEYLDLILAVRIVDSFEDAAAHIRRFGSGHTEAIVTRDYATAHRFVREIDASCVLVNASTRFNDGFELGLGAEIGISTSRLHAFGPMGLEELTARKFIVFGQGQTRS
jgi:glutamate-5-semialdehyde dehydrogenase